jgi:hypothetical protein
MSAGIAENIHVNSSGPDRAFVINLCASTSPMALTPPNSPELKRFTFFVSRQREDGRERFRLHMGYFTSQQEAENLLAAVRDVYPAAWVGPAPTTGAPRRARPITAMPAPIGPNANVAAPVAVAPVAPTAPTLAPIAKAVQQSKPAAANPAPPPKEQAPAKVPVLDSMSNVRDVIADLDAVATAASVSADTVLQILEPEPSSESPAQAKEVRVVTPEDTQTLTDIRLDAKNNAPPCFAVQLVWSVSPIDVSKLPHLAIFDAYTLYNVEGSRQGRKWFGLRLGFFSDPSSATQVAHYVRSDYQTVAVVPVAIKERDHAGSSNKSGQLPRLGASVPPAKPVTQVNLEKEGLQGFELLTDDRPTPIKQDVEKLAAFDDGNARSPQANQNPNVVPAKSVGKRVMVRKPLPKIGKSAAPAKGSLESTLDILGASTLTFDESREIINDDAVRKPVMRKPSGASSRFGKLLSRLGGN